MPGFRNTLRYLNGGRRNYGERPVRVYSRNFWEIKLVTEGACWPTFEMGQYRSLGERQTPCLYCFAPHLAHGWSDEPEGESVIEVMHFEIRKPELLEVFERNSPACLELSEEQKLNALAGVSQLVSHYKRPRAATRMATDAILYSLAAILIDCETRRASKPHRTFAAEKVRQAIDWYRANLADYPTIDSVAAGVGLSGTHLRRLFKQERIQSPLEVFESMRMEEARRLLKSEGSKVLNVALSLGYSEASSFSRAYKRFYGKSPGRKLAHA